MVVLGLNILHDATATLLIDGKIAASIAEERLSRIKYHCGFPYLAIAEVLRIAGVSAGDVEKVVFGFNSNFERMPRWYTDYVVERSGRFDIPVGRPRASQPDVLPNGPVEKHRVVTDPCHLLPPSCKVQAAQIGPVYTDMA